MKKIKGLIFLYTGWDKYTIFFTIRHQMSFISNDADDIQKMTQVNQWSDGTVAIKSVGPICAEIFFMKKILRVLLNFFLYKLGNSVLFVGHESMPIYVY